jgi:hypothetical protein
MDKKQSKIKSTDDGLNTKPANCGYTVCATVFEKHILHFDIGDSVYLKTDPEQCERLVTGVNIRQNGISYALSHLTNESYHYNFEITKERDIIKATSS